MSFRRRLTLAAAAAVAVAVVAASIIVFFVVRGELRDQVDSSLTELAGGATVEGTPVPPPPFARDEIPVPPPTRKRAKDQPRSVSLALPQVPAGVPAGYGQLVSATGDVVRGPGKDPEIPVGSAVREVAAGDRDGFFSDVDVNGAHLRVLTEAAGPGLAVQVARSMEETDASMRRIGAVLALVAAAGIGLAAVLGRAVASAAVAPVARLSETAEHVARTRDLARRIDVGGSDDELARLATSFNSMLAELESSDAAQRQLVADASHELRTPLTSLRTNLEVLASSDELARDERRRLLADTVAQLGELGVLVGNLVDLAREEEPAFTNDRVALDDVVGAAVERAARNAPGRRFETRLEPCAVRGNAERLDRAIGNVLDNAAKWSPADGLIEVDVSAAGVVRVRDHGPGIDPGDVPHVFDRFYRATSARGTPGSGLGLAIVHRIVDEHGGTVTVERPAGGGTLVRLRLPALPAERAEHDPSGDSSPILS